MLQQPPGGSPVTRDGPAVEDIAAAVYVIPTDAPEADGTLAWNETTMVLVTARAGREPGIGAPSLQSTSGGTDARRPPARLRDPDPAAWQNPPED